MVFNFNILKDHRDNSKERRGEERLFSVAL